MAKIKQGILGGFSGSVANIVGSSWKGIPVMKAKPLSVANPRTAGQVSQRTKFKSGSELSSALKNQIIKPFWDRFATKMSGVNAWMSDNVEKYDATGVPDLPNIVMSKGNIGAQTPITATYNSTTGLINISWNPTTIPANGLGTDIAAACAVSPDNVVCGIEEAGSIVRSDATLDIDTSDYIAPPTDSYAYIMFKRPDGTIVSDSSCKVITIS